MYKKMNGFGDAVQYSVFICDLSAKEKVILEQELTAILNVKEDQVIIVDMGPTEGRGQESFQVIGKARMITRQNVVVV